MEIGEKYKDEAGVEWEVVGKFARQSPYKKNGETKVLGWTYGVRKVVPAEDGKWKVMAETRGRWMNDLVSEMCRIAGVLERAGQTRVVAPDGSLDWESLAQRVEKLAKEERAATRQGTDMFLEAASLGMWRGRVLDLAKNPASWMGELSPEELAAAKKMLDKLFEKAGEPDKLGGLGA